MHLFEVIIEIVADHPAFGICFAFLIAALISLLLGFVVFAIACFVAALVIGALALFFESR